MVSSSPLLITERKKVMDLLIKGMKMPKEPTLVTIYPDGIWVEYTTDCSGRFVELPPHGRLIDADKFEADNPQHMDADVPYVTEMTVKDILDEAPTVIEASE